MKEFKIMLTVNGKRTEEIVRATSSIDAKELVKSKYPNCNIVIYSCQEIR